jgi:hypothetical protein
MQIREHQHNTPEQVEQYLTDALAMVKKLDPPSDLREVCFEKAANLLSSKQIFAEQGPAVPVMAIPQNARH